jgi:prepilin-type processing-associated H-X9-DG protein
MKVFRCPSTNPENTVNVILFFTAGTAGVHFPTGAGPGFSTSSSPGSIVLGRSTYAMTGGESRGLVLVRNSNPQRGVRIDGIFQYNSKNTIATIGDGSSNTVMFTESAPGLLSGQRMTQTWNFGMVYSEYGPPCNGNRANPLNGNCNGFAPLMANSLHTGGVINCCFGDGSVRPLKGLSLDFWHGPTIEDDGTKNCCRETVFIDVA